MNTGGGKARGLSYSSTIVYFRPGIKPVQPEAARACPRLRLALACSRGFAYSGRRRICRRTAGQPFSGRLPEPAYKPVQQLLQYNCMVACAVLQRPAPAGRLAMTPRFLEIEITGQCPCKCRHCYGNFPKAGELPLAKLREVLSQSRDCFDAVILSGGEPFLHPDLAGAVACASRDFVVFITTSGFAVTEKQLGQIGNRAILVFGLDGIGETHDAYRGVPGAFKTLVGALELTRDLPKEIIVSLWKGVLPQIDDILRLGEKYRAIVHFNFIIPVGRARTNREIHPGAHDLDMLYQKLYGLKKVTGAVTTDLYRVTARDRHEGIDLFCRGRFNITPSGDVRPCEFHHAVLGNIYRRPFRDILQQARRTVLIRSRENGFKNHIPAVMENPFDYHTSICHRLPCTADDDSKT